jgi:hypothetical protein
MHSDARRLVLVVAVLGVAFSRSHTFAQTAGSAAKPAASAPDLAHFGMWRINLAKTAAANGVPFTRGDTFTWIYQPEGDGIRHTIYETYPAPAPTRSYFARLDGKPYPNPHGAGRGLEGCVGDCQEFVRLLSINRYTVVREVVTKGKWTERVMWSVAEDGKTMVNVNVPPGDPIKVNRMVFDRVEMPAASR